MVKVVTSGTGTAAALKSVQVAGKPGLAEAATGAARRRGSPASRPADDCRSWVAGIVENGGNWRRARRLLLPAKSARSLGRDNCWIMELGVGGEGRDVLGGRLKV